MIQRAELEQTRSLSEMRLIVKAFANDVNSYRNEDVRRRTGVAKDIAEEYYPLFLLVQHLPHIQAAYLTPRSHPGPDAIVVFADGSSKSVQITSAGESHSTALQRELLNRGQVVFPNKKAHRAKRLPQIVESGRVLHPTGKHRHRRPSISGLLPATPNPFQPIRGGWTDAPPVAP